MSATTFLRRRNYAGDTCKNEEFPAATFGKAFCIFRYLGVAKNKEKHDKEEKNYVFMEEGTIWTRFDTLPDTLNPARTSSRRKLENLTLGLDSQRGADE